MPINAANWVGENTATIGTGDIRLGGAIAGFARFNVMGDGQVYYCVQDGLAKETGVGTLTGNVLSRTAITATIDKDGVYSETPAPIALSGNAQVFGIINADFMKILFNNIEDFNQAVIDATTAATNAKTSETNAKTSETNSAASASAALQSETNAAQSETNAKSSENISVQKAIDAAASAASAKSDADRAETANPDNQLKKANNLSDVADRAVSWLNIRPIGATPLAADPIGVLDAATRGWCLGKMENPLFANNATSMHKETTLPTGATAGGYVASSLYEGNNEIAVGTYSIAYTKGTPTAVTRLITAIRAASGYPAKSSTFAHDSEGNISFDGEGRGKVFSGRDGAFGPAVIKKADRSSVDADNVNYLSQVANNTTTIYNYLVSPSGSEQQFVTRMDVNGQQIKYFSIRVDNGSYTPEGRLAVQGSDVRIKDGFKPAKEGAWDRIEQIGIMEYYYRGNPIPQRGWLAQQMGDIDDLYVFPGGTAHDIDGEEFTILNVNDKAVIADLVVTVQMLQKQIRELQNKLGV